jgi:hypothetical protein
MFNMMIYNYSNKAKHNLKSFFRIMLLICLLFFQNLNGMPLSDSSVSSSDESPLLLDNLKSNQMAQDNEAVISPFKLADDNNNQINSKNENFLQNLNNILAAESNENDKKKLSATSNINLLPSSNQNMEDEENDAYFKYIRSSSSSSNLNHRNHHYRQMMKTQKKSSSFKFNSQQHHPSFSNMNNRKIFRVDKNLQRLEKKSWKIPIKTVALYKNVENQSPQKMVGELNELFDSFKNS